MSTLTPAQLAEELQTTVEEVERLRKVKGWPHMKLNRQTVRYTRAQADNILALLTVERETPKPTNGQTAASARRSA